MNTAILVSTFCASLILATAQAAEAPAYQKESVVTNGIRFEAGFTPERNEITLGEPLYVMFYVTNTGDQTFYLEIGGDSRGVRSSRFQFQAANKNGHPVPDPNPDAANFGGMQGPPPEVAPGKTYSEMLYLPLWVKFEQPGEYVVRGRRVVQILKKQEFSRDYAVVHPLNVEFRLAVLPKNAERLGKRIQQLGNMLDSDDFVRATRQLADIDDERVVPYLVRVIEEDKRDALAVAATGLGKHPGPEAIVALTKALKDGRDSYVRSSAASAMGNMKSSAAMDALIVALGDENDYVRREVVAALGRSRDKKAVGVLKTRLTDSSMVVRLAVVEALLALGESFNAEWVGPIIKSKDPVFQNAIWLVRKNAGSNAPTILAECLDASNPSVTNYYNYTLAWQIHACGGPKITYHHNFDKEGTPEQIEENRKELQTLQVWMADHAKATPGK